MVCRSVAETDDLRSWPPSTGHGRPVDRRLIGHPKIDVPISEELDRLLEARSRWRSTSPPRGRDGQRAVVRRARDPHRGRTTGLTGQDLAQIPALLEPRRRANVIVAPNFALGAVLMQRFAARPSGTSAVEVIELHHDAKADAPSGTSLRRSTACSRSAPRSTWGRADETIAGVRGGDREGIRVHSVRLPGLLAHQESSSAAGADPHDPPRFDGPLVLSCPVCSWPFARS